MFNSLVFILSKKYCVCCILNILYTHLRFSLLSADSWSCCWPGQALSLPFQIYFRNP